MRVPYIRVFGRTYLYGRKVKFPALALLAVRDVIILPFFKKVQPLSPNKRGDHGNLCMQARPPW